MINIADVEQILQMPKAQLRAFVSALCVCADTQSQQLDFDQLQLVIACNFFVRAGLKDYEVLTILRPWAQVIIDDARRTRARLDVHTKGQPLQIFPLWLVFYDERYSGVLCEPPLPAYRTDMLYDSAELEHVQRPRMMPGSCLKVCPLAVYLRTTAFAQAFNHNSAHGLVTAGLTGVKPQECE